MRLTLYLGLAQLLFAILLIGVLGFWAGETWDAEDEP